MENDRREGSAFSYDPRLQDLLIRYNVGEDLIERGKNIDNLAVDLGLSETTRTLLSAVHALNAIYYETSNNPKASIKMNDLSPTVATVIHEIKQKAQAQDTDMKVEIVSANLQVTASEDMSKHFEDGFSLHEIDEIIDPFREALSIAERML